jgi:hypothetical protein
MNARGFFSHRTTSDHLKVGVFNPEDGNKKMEKKVKIDEQLEMFSKEKLKVEYERAEKLNKRLNFMEEKVLSSVSIGFAALVSLGVVILFSPVPRDDLGMTLLCIVVGVLLWVFGGGLSILIIIGCNCFG